MGKRVQGQIKDNNKISKGLTNIITPGDRTTYWESIIKPFCYRLYIIVVC